MSNDKKNDSNIDLDLENLIDFDYIDQVAAAFNKESEEILSDLEDTILQLEQANSEEALNILFRKVHTLKGSVGAVPGGQLVGSVAHEFEALLSRVKKEQQGVDGPTIELFLKSSRILKDLCNCLRERRELHPEELSEAIELITEYGIFSLNTAPKKPQRAKNKNKLVQSRRSQGILVSNEHFKELMKISGELLVLKNFFQMIQKVDFRSEPELFKRRQNDFNSNLKKVSDDLQKQLGSVSDDLSKNIFHGLELLVRQVATDLNKSVKFELLGGDILIDKVLGREIYDVLIHIIRNSLDHGIEDPFERAINGKPTIGSIKLEVSKDEEFIQFQISDDGNGLDREKIVNKAIQENIISAAEALQLDEDGVYKLIFESGFSTSEKVTTVSGRGMGMDIVKTTVEDAGGQLLVSSIAGAGLSIALKLPVPRNIRIETTLLGTWQGHCLAFPVSSILRVVNDEATKLHSIEGDYFIEHEGKTLPLISYHNVIGEKTEQLNLKRISFVILNHKKSQVAFLIDEIESQTDLVLKSFGDFLKDQKGCKGLSVLADERIVFVLDVEKVFAELKIQMPTAMTRKAA